MSDLAWASALAVLSTAVAAATVPTQDFGVLSEVLKVTPSAVSTILVIVVVWAFLKHERARDMDFREMLTEQRKEGLASLEALTERQVVVMEKVADNLDRLADGQTRILEAVHGCAVRHQA